MVDRRPVFLAPSGALAEVGTGDLISTAVLPDFARTQNPTAEKATNYSASLHEIVMANASSGPITITLPAISGRARVSVKKIDSTSNVVTVAAGTAAGGGAQTVGSAAAASIPIRTMDQVTTFQGNGTNWVIPYNHLSLSALDTRHSRSHVPSHAGNARGGWYDPIRTLYTPSSAALRAIRGHVDRAAAGELVNMVCAGDSRTAGHMVGSQNSWVNQIKALFTAAGVPSGGTGLVQAANGVGSDSRITQTGSSWSQIPPYRQWAATGQTCTFVSDSAGTVAEVFYYDNSGTFTVKVDSAAAVAVTPGGTATIKKYTVTGLANTTHTIVVNSTSVGGFLIGFCVRGTTGLLVNPVAISGTHTTTTAANSQFTDLQRIVDFISPSIYCLMNGAADALPGNNFPPTTTAANYATILGTNNAARAQFIIAQSGPPNIPAAQWDPYVSVMYDAADTYGIPLLDLQDRWGGPDAGFAAGVLQSDKLHETTAGYSEIARSVVGMLAR